VTPDYGGYGASWTKSRYHGVAVEVPQSLHKFAGPRSTVRQKAYPAFSGLGYVPFNDSIVTIGEDPITRVDVWGWPIDEAPEGQGPVQPKENYWPLLIILGGIVLLSQKKTRR
jgi:hypothetical protein